MSVPKSVIKIDKNGVTYTSSCDRVQYTIKELKSCAKRRWQVCMSQLRCMTTRLKDAGRVESTHNTGLNTNRKTQNYR